MKSLNKSLVALAALAWMIPIAHAADEHAGHAMPQMAADQTMSQMSGDHAMPQMAGDQAMPQAGQMDNMEMSEGVIRKVDKSAGKLTIKHGPLVNLGMMPMTMVFRVTDPAMLDQVKAGDKIHFRAENNNGALTVTNIEPVSP